MRYNIRVVLNRTERLVYFDEIFLETMRGFLDLTGDLPQNALGKFSYGTVYGGKMIQNNAGQNVLSFPLRAFWNFSCVDEELMNTVRAALERKMKDGTPFAFEMTISRVEVLPQRYKTGVNFIKCYPGIMMREMDEDGMLHFLTLRDDGNDFLDALERNTSEKIAALDPNIDPRVYINPVEGEIYKHKTAWFDNISYLYNEGVFSIDATKEAMELIACVGLGDMTHLGFGHITSMDNPALHRHPNYKARQLNNNETLWTRDGGYQFNIEMNEHD